MSLRLWSTRNRSADSCHRRQRRTERQKLRPQVEQLESRTVPTINLSTSSWTAIGPDPISGNVELGHPVGRTNAVASDPTDANVMYLASAGGGIWKTTNWLDPNGPTWTAETDNLGSPSTGGYHGIGVAPSNHLVVYATSSGVGGGIIRSQDGGQTWATVGNATFDGASIGSLAIDPTDANTLYVSVWYGGSGGGIYKSTDGGVSWDNKTSSFHSGGASDIVINPATPSILYAGLVYGSTAGIYKTTNGGTSWVQMTNGVLSGSAVGGAIHLALAPSAPGTVYATVFDPALGGGNGGLPHRYKTTNGGGKWTPLAATPGNAESRSWHVLLSVDPNDAQDVFASDAYSLYRSKDGGKTWSSGAPFGDDFVGMAFDPAGGWDLFGDRSIYRSTTQGASYTPQQGNLQITQFYDLTLDPTDPNNIYGVAQDHPVAMQFSGDPGGVWDYINGGGETGKILIDPTNPQHIYEFNPLAGDWFVMTSQDGGQSFTGSLPNMVNAGSDYGLAYACQRSFAMDPTDPDHVLAGLNSSFLYETTDGGQNWVKTAALPLSPAPMNPLYITSLAIGPDGKTFYAGASNGSFWTGKHVNGKTQWTEADAGLFGAAKGNVVDIRISPTDAQNLYVVTNGTQGHSVWHSTSGGIANPFTAWVDVSGNLPTQYRVSTLAVDWTTSPPAVYVGTSRGVYSSTDIPAGAPNPGDPPPDTHWNTFDAGLPNCAIADLEYAPKLGILAAGTSGHGAYEILLHQSLRLAVNINAVACADLPCILEEVTIAVDPNPEGHVVATFTDTDGPGPIDEYRARLQWGTGVATTGIITYDGTSQEFSVHVNETAPEGRYPLSITIYKDGLPASPVTADVQVNDAPLSGNGFTLGTARGRSFTGQLATVHDAGGLEGVGHYSATVDWGDRTALDHTARLLIEDGALKVFGTHTYATLGQFTAHVVVTDEGGSSVPIDTTVQVTRTGPAPTPTQPGFATRAGGTGTNAGLATATAANGNVVVVGTFQGPATFPGARKPITLPGFGGTDAYVAMYSPAGRLLWVRAMGGPGEDMATGVAVSGDGQVYVTGNFQGTAKIGGSKFTAVGASDAFVVKLDGNGNFAWSHHFAQLHRGNLFGEMQGVVADGAPLGATTPDQLGNSFAVTAAGIAVDATGAVYVTGTFDQEVDFGGATLSGDSARSAYLAKLGSGGGLRWVKQMAGPDVVGTSVAVGPSGVYTLGDFHDSVTFGDGSVLRASAPTALFLTKTSPTGTLLWARPVVAGSDVHAAGLAVDPSGNALVTGNLVGDGSAMDFDPTATHSGDPDVVTPPEGSSNLFVEKFSAGGAFTWVRVFGSDLHQRASTGIATDAKGNVFVAGNFQTATSFGGATLTGGGATTAFIAELDSRGAGVQAMALGNGDGSKATGLFVRDGFVGVTGEFQGTFQIGNFPALTVGGGAATLADADATAGTDMFFARLKLKSNGSTVR